MRNDVTSFLHPAGYVPTTDCENTEWMSRNQRAAPRIRGLGCGLKESYKLEIDGGDVYGF